MSIIAKLKNTKLYAFYHFHAKYFKTRHDSRLDLAKGVKAESLFNDDKVHFFGYYDKPCVAYGHSLSHRLNIDNFNYQQTIDILVDDRPVSTSKAWNLQQGSMSSWIDERHIIHNDFDGEKYISRIIDIQSGEQRIIHFPIYSLAKNKQFALSLNFSRLAKLRKDYGYFNLPYEQLSDPSEDGIYYVDLINDTHELWLTLEEIMAFKPRLNMQGAQHKVNHLDISPDNSKAIFLHRWFVDGKKYTRLLCVDIQTKELTLLADNDMVSHMYWYNDNKVFGYLRGNNGKDGYFFIDLKGNQEQFEHELLVDDGHPTVLDERFIITDAYPDYTCKSKLLLIDLQAKTVEIIARYYSGKKYQDDRRCDLHPRFDADKKALTIDTVCDGVRNIYHLDIREFIMEKKNIEGKI